MNEQTLDEIRKVLFGDEEAWKVYEARRNESPAVEKPEKGLIDKMKDVERALLNIKARFDDYGGDYSLYSWTPGNEWSLSPIRWVQHKQRQERVAWDVAQKKIPSDGWRRFIHNCYGSWPPPNLYQFVTGALGYMYEESPPGEPTWLFKARRTWHDRIIGWRGRIMSRVKSQTVCYLCRGKGTYDAGSLGHDITCDECSVFEEVSDEQFQTG